jgi:hypothetical protein
VGGNVFPGATAGTVFTEGNEVGISVGNLGGGMEPQAVKNLLNVSEPALSIMRRRKSRRENLFISASLTGKVPHEKFNELTGEMQVRKVRYGLIQKTCLFCFAMFWALSGHNLIIMVNK